LIDLFANLYGYIGKCLHVMRTMEYQLLQMDLTSAGAVIDFWITR